MSAQFVSVKNAFALPVNSQIVLRGWVRSRRDSKGVTFIELNDGSRFKSMQLVVEAGTIPEETLRQVTTGSSIAANGTLVESPAKGERKMSDFAKIGQKKGGSPHGLDIGAGSARDRFLDQSVVHSDAQFVMEQAKKYGPLFGRRHLDQFSEPRIFLLARALARSLGDLREAFGNVGDCQTLQNGSFGFRNLGGMSKRAGADVERARIRDRKWPARQERNGSSNLVGFEPAQISCSCIDFDKTARCFLKRAAQRREFRELHGSSLTRTKGRKTDDRIQRIGHCAESSLRASRG